MIAKRFLEHILVPGLETLRDVSGVHLSQDAIRWLLAVAIQESALAHRYQVLSTNSLPGPARGWWQFEREGGVTGVLTHKVSRVKAKTLCEWYGVEPEPHPVWRTLEGHDGLAVGFARLLLLTDPNPVPTNESSAWTCYIKLWRPGRPRVQTWSDNWRIAEEAMQ